MPTKKLPAKTTGEVGAPAAAKRLEGREADVWGRIERLEDDLGKTDVLLAQADGDTEEQEKLSKKIERINKDLLATYKLWFELTKQVREFDKSIDTSRREGEKILVSEAKEIFAQYELSILTAIESYVIAISQKAALCESPEEFYVAHADAIKTARETAISSAISDGVIPVWLQ